MNHVLHTLSSSSGQTLDKTLECTYNLYSSHLSDTLNIDYGDSTSETIQLNLSKFSKNLNIQLF